VNSPKKLSSENELLVLCQACTPLRIVSFSPEPIGDYCSGTNHVLPTYGYARSFSGLTVGDFMRSMTVQELSVEGRRQLGPIGVTLARLEGLDAHAAAVDARLTRLASGAQA